MKAFKTGLLLIVSITLAMLSQACQKAEDYSDVNQDKIHQNIELQYNSAEDKTYATVQFRFGNAIGTPLELAGTAKVTVDGNTMAWNDNFNLNRYEWSATGKLSSATFEYTDIDGNVFTNTATINDIEFPTTFTTISKAQSYDLIWVGSSLNTDDEVWVYLNEDNEANGALFKQTNDNATSITIDKAGMAKIDPSTITVWIDRNNKPAITQATSAGGIINGQYRAIATGINLTN